ncbi:hypothetical protein SAMN05216276_1008220 [Streptosporangium subroseum]|uniref:Uncharacterized protein n=1 Tax=Streptosporangium subroseum TaxID=106412 RepID=A0A239E4G6_9ACTN|nr:hypothetical protein [Streptosporangium subroseum]SNS39507.1 hypothetical protein SAMN05216276_1008220 [Streptosporangium subroseum]
MVQRTSTASNGRTRARADQPQRPHVSVPVIGTLTLPPPDRLVFYAVLGALGALEIIEWPIALVVGVGHYLTEQRFSPALQEAGQAAEAA